MPQLIWAPGAAADVQRLYRFLLPQNADAARQAVTAIRSGVTVLSRQPRIGRPVEDMPAEFRDWLIDFGSSGYVVRYRIEDDVVTILAVRHLKEVGF
ncbi:type II toxin-antitoxin system RelE/ParE family toxin [Roseibium marinum]|uniref:Plasmid stabilization system protein ParE n=1 Tax=Roseibium marinum TaxID=281252 RepID=A0A2S3URK3_9HYPH|nr:type II toxin-antitoxin system RelE/ParE family toxin [Roseibium marinum]POF30183.1 plasmid stabilization system protein ParE [Roseibium marinum]